MKLVIIESPYAGDVARNVAYARACVKDSLSRGEAPIASHLLHTQPGIMDDRVPEQRKLGIGAGHAWMEVCQVVAVYRDYGISPGMKAGIRIANRLKVPVEFRYLKEGLAELIEEAVVVLGPDLGEAARQSDGGQEEGTMGRTL